MGAPRFSTGARVFFHDVAARVTSVDTNRFEPRYYLEWGDVPIRLWAPESMLSTDVSGVPHASTSYTRHTPHMLIVDQFYKDPDAMRRLALAQDFRTEAKSYKGVRTFERILFPAVREEFERLLNVKITDWLSQPANGVFQVTQYGDPLVWHSDTQSYAAAIYLTPQAPPASGTSFWRDKTFKCRRPPNHPLERARFVGQDTDKIGSEIYNDRAYLDGSRWELVDQVGAVYNRLVIWDAQLIHSATSYDAFVTPDGAGAASVSPLESGRLVQLFFFDIANPAR